MKISPLTPPITYLIYPKITGLLNYRTVKVIVFGAIFAGLFYSIVRRIFFSYQQQIQAPRLPPPPPAAVFFRALSPNEISIPNYSMSLEKLISTAGPKYLYILSLIQTTLAAYISDISLMIFRTRYLSIKDLAAFCMLAQICRIKIDGAQLGTFSARLLEELSTEARVALFRNEIDQLGGVLPYPNLIAEILNPNHRLGIISLQRFYNVFIRFLTGDSLPQEKPLEFLKPLFDLLERQQLWMRLSVEADHLSNGEENKQQIRAFTTHLFIETLLNRDLRESFPSVDIGNVFSGIDVYRELLAKICLLEALKETFPDQVLPTLETLDDDDFELTPSPESLTRAKTNLERMIRSLIVDKEFPKNGPYRDPLLHVARKFGIFRDTLFQSFSLDNLGMRAGHTIRII